MNTKTNLTAITTDVNVGMNEVVSVFVAKYEDGLFAKKDVLSSSIRGVKAHLSQIDSDLIKSVHAEDYDAEVPKLGLSFKMGDVAIQWEGNYNTPKNTLVVEVEMFDKSNERNHASYTKRHHITIDKAVIDDRQETKDQLEQLNADLLEVMSLIKTVSRKERQIRGRISEMKLAESGLSELINNSEILQLVKID